MSSIEYRKHVEREAKKRRRVAEHFGMGKEGMRRMQAQGRVIRGSYKPGTAATLGFEEAKRRLAEWRVAASLSDHIQGAMLYGKSIQQVNYVEAELGANKYNKGNQMGIKVGQIWKINAKTIQITELRPENKIKYNYFNKCGLLKTVSHTRDKDSFLTKFELMPDKKPQEIEKGQMWRRNGYGREKPHTSANPGELVKIVAGRPGGDIVYDTIKEKYRGRADPETFLKYFYLVKGSRDRPDAVQEEPLEMYNITKEHMAAWQRAVNNFNKPTEENKMSKLIETRTYINGSQAELLNDEQIFEYLEEANEELNKLRGMQVQSKKLTAKADELEAMITELVKFVDERE